MVNKNKENIFYTGVSYFTVYLISLTFFNSLITNKIGFVWLFAPLIYVNFLLVRIFCWVGLNLYRRN